MRDNDNAIERYYHNFKEYHMNAGKTMRELKLLDQLEIRVKNTVNPDPKILAEIQREKERILGSKEKQ